MSASNLDPHDKMRARDISRVARGEQAPRPAHEPGTVSRAPPPSSVRRDPAEPEPKPKPVDSMPERADTPVSETRHCYASYVEYPRCLKEKGERSPECQKLERHYRSLCPSVWIERWDQQRAQGTFPI